MTGHHSSQPHKAKDADRSDGGGAIGQGVTFVDAGAGDAGQRIDNFLLRHLKKVPKSHVYRVLRKGEVRINGKRAKPEQRLAEGDRIRIPPIRIELGPGVAPPSKSLQALILDAVIYEDDDILAINKPAGVAVHGGSGLSHGVIEALRTARPELPELELVHRLDRDTSGCLLVAKRRAALRQLHAALREREMVKKYLALVCGQWRLGTKKLDMPLKTNQKQGGERMVKVHPEGQAAESTFKVLEKFGPSATLMEVHIGTGRTHQIRVHAAYAGHPIAGDEKYGDRACNESLKAMGLRRMFLHAQALTFIQPRTGKQITITAPLDEDLEAALGGLRKSKPEKSTKVDQQSRSG